MLTGFYGRTQAFRRARFAAYAIFGLLLGSSVAWADVYDADSGLGTQGASLVLDGTSGFNLDIDTDALTMSGAATKAGEDDGGVAVFRFDYVNVTNAQSVVVTGSRPLAIVSATDMQWDAFINASNGILGGGLGGGGGPAGTSGGIGGVGGTTGGAGGARTAAGSAGVGGPPTSGGNGGRNNGSNGGAGGPGTAGSDGIAGGSGSNGFGAAGSGGAAGARGIGGSQNNSGGAGGSGGTAASAGNGGAGAVDANAGPGGSGLYNAVAGGSGGSGQNGGNGTNGGDGNDGNFTADPNTLVIAAGHGGAGGGGGGKGGGGQGGGKGGGGGSGGGGGGGGGMNGTGSCSGDANGGIGGQGGAGGHGGNGGNGRSSGPAGHGGNGGNGGGAVVMAAKGLLRFGGTVDISPGLRNLGLSGSAVVPGFDPGFNGGLQEGSGTYQNAGGGGNGTACFGNSCPTNFSSSCGWPQGCPGCSTRSGGVGGTGSTGRAGGRGGAGGDGGASGSGGDGGYGTPGMVKLQGTVIIGNTGSVLTSNTGGSAAASRNGRLTMISNMTSGQTTARTPGTAAFLVKGQTTNAPILQGTTPYDTRTDHPLIGEMVNGPETHGVMASTFWNQSVLLPLASQRLEVIRVSANTANNPFQGFDQIFLVNNTPFIDTVGTTLEGVYLKVGANAEVLIEAGGASGELPDGVVYATTVLAGQSVQINTVLDIANPADQIAQPYGLPVDFSTSVNQGDGNVTFQWQESTDNVSFFDVIESATYSGTTTSTLSVIANNATDGKYYRVVARDNTDTTTSQGALLTTNLFFEVEPPAITGPNLSGKYYFNEQVVLETQITGPTEQWRTRWTREDIGFPFTQTTISTEGPNDNNFPELTIPPTLPATAANEGGYRVIGDEFTGGGSPTGTLIQRPGSGLDAIDIEFRAPVNPGTPTGAGSYLAGTAFNSTVSPVGGYLPLTYQWQFSDGIGPFVNISDGGVVSGTQTPSLSISALNAIAHDGFFRVVVSDSHTDTNNISASIEVIVTTALGIIPRTGTATGIDGLVASSTDLTTVYSDLPIGGGNVTLGMTAVGGIGTYTYQWFKDGIGPIDGTEFLSGASYSGFATDTLTIDPMNSGNLTAGVYTCRVFDPAGPVAGVLSSGITVTVAGPFFFSVQPANDTVNVTESSSFTVTAQGGIAPRSYQWQQFDGIATWNDVVDGGGYAGATTNTLVIDPVNLTTHPGDYRCVVDDSGAGVTGPRQIISNTGTLTVTNDLDVSVPDLSVYDGDNPVVIAVTPGGGNPGTYAYTWERDTGSGFVPVVDGGNISGSGTDTLTISPASTSDAGTYRVTLNDGIEPTPGVDTGVLGVFQKPTITVQPQPYNTYDGNTANFSITVTGGIGPLSYDWRLDSFSLGLPSQSTAAFPVILANDGSLVDVFVEDTVASDATAVQESVTSASVALGVGVLLEVGAPTPTPIQVYSDAAPFNLNSVVTGGFGPLTYVWRLTDGANVVVLGAGDGAGNVTIDPSAVPQGDYDATLTITDNVGPTASAPAIVEIKNHLSIVPPGLEDAEASVDDSFTYAIAIDGGISPVTFEWSFDNGSKAFVPIPSATGPSVTLNPVVAEDEGTYQVVVTDANNEQVTDSAYLTVSNALPVTGGLGLGLLAALSALGGVATIRRRKS